MKSNLNGTDIPNYLNMYVLFAQALGLSEAFAAEPAASRTGGP